MRNTCSLGRCKILWDIATRALSADGGGGGVRSAALAREGEAGMILCFFCGERKVAAGQKRKSEAMMLAVATLSSVLAVTTPPRLVVGLNKYSHDAAATVLDANSGRVRYSAARERLTRKKHDGGGCGALVAAGVASAGGTLCDVAAVVANNHHAPIAPLERRLAAWAESLNAGDEMISRLDAANLLPEVPRRIEMSHHLAHAAAASATAPFDSGLVVVMDGMGERRSDLVGRVAGAAPLDRVDYSAAEWPEYVSDALLPGYDTCVQAGATTSDAARESESVTSSRRWWRGGGPSLNRLGTFLQAYLFETVVARGGRRRPRLQRGRGGGRGGKAHAARESGRSPSPAGTACCGPCNLPTSPHISPHLQAPRAAARVQAVGRRDVPARLLRLVPRLRRARRRLLPHVAPLRGEPTVPEPARSCAA